MGEDNNRDTGRQVANVLGALLQIVVPIFTGEAINQVSSEGPGSLVAPAGYAFIIWGPITLLSLAYAVYQALPFKRKDPLLRRVGWFTAGTFLLNAIWESVVPLRQIFLAEVIILGMLACLAVAHLSIMGSGRGVLGAADRWLVVLPVALYFGWITAANAVSFVTTLVYLEVLPARGVEETLVGASSLVFGGLLAYVVLRIGKRDPPHGSLVYAGTVLWALVTITVNQYDDSPITTAAAVISTVPVTLALFRPS